MKNISEFKKEYLDYKDKMYEIDKALEENVNEYLKVEKNKDFVFIESDMFHELVESHIDEIKEEGPNFKIPNMEELEKEYEEYCSHLNKMIEKRIELYNERLNVVSEFEKYMEKNNFIYWDIEEDWCKEVKKYENKWYGWSSNDLICDAMYRTIYMIDEDEVNMVIENAKKVLNLIEGRSYNSGYVNDLEFINKYLRHGEGCDGCEHVFVLDCLENDCMWDIYREPFERFVQKVMYNIDRDYIDYLKELEVGSMHDDLEK